MAIDPVRHAIMLGASVICGVLLAVFYELMGMFPCFWALVRSRCKNRTTNKFLKDIILFFKDLFFCFIIGCVLVLVIYLTNDGEFRIMAPIGMAFGFIVGRKTLGRMIRYFTALFARLLLKVLEVILRPIIFFGCKIKKLFVMLIDRVGRRIKDYSRARTATDGSASNNHGGIKGKNGKRKKQDIYQAPQPIDSIGAGTCGSNLNWNIR